MRHIEPIQKMLLFFFLVTVLSATTAQSDFDHPIINNQIYLHSSKTASSSGDDEFCLTWRFGVESNNVIDWTTIPPECEIYIGTYMLGPQYANDVKLVAKEAYRYAQTVKLSDDGKDVWIFDVDETALCNLAYYAKHGFGSEPYNPELIDEWILSESATALPKILKLYKRLQSLGIKIVFLTERRENKRFATENNLRVAGYRTWELSLFKPEDFSGTSVEYKQAQRRYLLDAGYRIVGNIGDQWSDILGTDPAPRSYKVPNPMYHIA